jgi:uroporphyrinogen III methyltransferase / synthase
MTTAPGGLVSIVGAGPGDPELLTLKALDRLTAADVVLYDQLLDAALLAHAGPHCQRIFVGKSAGNAAYTQEQISALLLDHAQRGRRVVRLKGGDPFIFGRGAEEALALHAANIPFEIVPGVSAAAAAPAYAGIPVTHRGLAAAAVLVTGHEDPAKPEPTVDWSLYAAADCTLLIFMGTRKLPAIARQLIKGGRAGDTPVAAIEHGTWASQRTIVAPLAQWAEAPPEADLASPTLIVVGQVVQLHKQLAWFEQRPLHGRRILLTRRREQSGPLRQLLGAAGAQVLELPLIELASPEDTGPLDTAIARLHQFGWCVFTSTNALAFFYGRLQAAGLDTRALGPVRVAAVGPGTAAALLERGVEADLVPESHSQEGLLAALCQRELSDVEVLVPASELGADQLDAALEGRGARVTRAIAYTNRSPVLDPDRYQDILGAAAEPVDAVVFASPSAARNLRVCVGDAAAQRLLHHAAIACIGPTTAATVSSLGLTVDILPDTSSVPALAQALGSHFARRS